MLVRQARLNVSIKEQLHLVLDLEIDLLVKPLKRIIINLSVLHNDTDLRTPKVYKIALLYFKIESLLPYVATPAIVFSVRNFFC